MLFRAVLLIAVLNLSACANFRTHHSTSPEPPADAATSPAKHEELKPTEAEVSAQEAKARAEDQVRTQELRDAVAAEAAKHSQKTHNTKVSREAGPVPADKSLGWLKNGNTRYTTGRLRADGAKAKDRARLTSGQQPHAIILSCSDSRVPPELVFDQKLGEISVIRTGGEALDDNVVGTIEHAVQHLGTNLIVVMGHSSCGEVKAALASLAGNDLGSPALNTMIADLKPRLQQFVGKKPSEGLVEESWANVAGVANDLLARSQILRDATASGEVKIVRAIYSLDSGKVEWQE